MPWRYRPGWLVGSQSHWKLCIMIRVLDFREGFSDLCDPSQSQDKTNKANLRDLIATTGLVISNWIQIVNFSACVTMKFDGWPWKNHRALLLYYIKLCASFQIHRWIQTVVTVRKRPIWVKIDDFFSRVTLKFDRWLWKIIGHLFYAASSFVHHFVAISKFKLELQSGNAQFGSISTIF